MDLLGENCMNSLNKKKLEREVNEKIFYEDMEISSSVFKNIRYDLLEVLKKYCMFLDKNVFINVKELSDLRLIFRLDVVIDEVFEICDF